MAYKRGILDSAEALWLIVATLGSILAVLGIKAVYSNRTRLLRKLKAFTRSIKRRRLNRKILVQLDERSTRDLAKIAFSLIVWPKYGFPDRLLYMPRPPHYKPALKMENLLLEGFQYPLTISTLDELTRKDLLLLIKTVVQKRSLLSLQWILAFLKGRALDAERRTESVATTPISDKQGHPGSGPTISPSSAGLRDRDDSTTSSGFVELCPTGKMSGALQWRDCLGEKGATLARNKPLKFRGFKSGTKVIISSEILQRVTTKMKNDKSETGTDFSGLVELLLWEYLGRPDDLLDE